MPGDTGECNQQHLTASSTSSTAKSRARKKSHPNQALRSVLGKEPRQPVIPEARTRDTAQIHALGCRTPQPRPSPQTQARTGATIADSTALCPVLMARLGPMSRAFANESTFSQEKGGRLLTLLPTARKHCEALQTNRDQSGDLNPQGGGSRHVVTAGHIKPFCPAQLRAVPRTKHPPCQAVAEAPLRAAVAGMRSAFSTFLLGAAS